MKFSSAKNARRQQLDIEPAKITGIMQAANAATAWGKKHPNPYHWMKRKPSK